MNTIFRRGALALLLAVLLTAALIPTAFAASSHISVSKPAAVTVSQGEQYALDLSKVFSDSQGHRLNYSVSNDTQNHATTALSGGVYYFTSPATGSFAPTITARCSECSASATLNITVKEGAILDPMQYDYDESDAAQVTVYVTVSGDGVPFVGADSDATILSHLAVTVPYFDLRLYGLEDFYRFGTDGGHGSYVNDTVIRRPTAMHLFLYLLERYYLGYPADECGTGEHVDELFGGSRYDEVLNMFGDVAHVGEMSPLRYSGSATSTYMVNFWGHDENLMYYRNHRYPLMSPGWGSTADYILLSDGDTMDVAMFTNWDFYTRGAFCCFGTSRKPVDSFKVDAGTPLQFTTLQFGTRSVAEGGEESFSPISDLMVQVYDADWNYLADIDGSGSSYSYTFDEAGTYYLLGLDPNAMTEDACFAPATAKVTVRASCNGQHSYDSGKVTTPATCTAKGVKTYTCTRCGSTYTESIPTAAHREVTDPAVAATYTKTGLTAGSHCSVCGKVLTAQTATPMKTLAKPAIVSASNGSTGITLKWDKVTGATGYQLYRSAGGGSFERIATVTGGGTLSYVDADLTSGAGYQYKLYATADTNRSAASEVFTKYYVGKPVITSASNGASGITLKWDKVRGADGYHVYRSTDSGKSFTKIATVAASDAPSYADLGRKSGTGYQYKVSAYLDVGGERYLSISSAVKAKYYLAKPTITSVTNGTSGITLKWDAVPGADSYCIYRSDDGGKSFFILTSTADLSCPDYGCRSGAGYQYKITACRAVNGTIYRSTASAAKTKYYLAKPSITSVTNGASGITLKWDAVQGAGGYYVYRSDDGGKTYTKIASVAGGELSYADLNRVSGVKYRYKVSACLTSKGSTYVSTSSAVKSKCYVAKPVISSLTNGTTGITVKWSAVQGASGYYVYRSDDGGKTYTKVKTVVGGSTLSYIDANRESGARYRYKVSAYITMDGSTYVGVRSAVKSKYYVAKPVLSSVVSSGAGKVTVKWQTVAGSDGYQICYEQDGELHSVYVRDPNTVSKALTGLKKGSTYTVYVRAYKLDGQYYYSGHSAEKSIKITK